MSTDLNRQLRSYGDVVSAKLDTVNVEDIMSTKLENKNVATLTPAGQKPSNNWRRSLGYAAAAFGLILAVGIAATMALSGSGEVAQIIPAPPFETPADAAVVYLDNVNGDGDYVAYGAMFTTDAQNGHLDVRDPMDEAKKQQRYEAFAAEDLYIELTGCPQPEARVASCKVILRTGALVAFQEPPFTFQMLVELSPEGLINRLELTPETGSFTKELQFKAWMDENYPELSDEFYLQLYGVFPLVRPVAQVIADVLAAEREFIAENP